MLYKVCIYYVYVIYKHKFTPYSVYKTIKYTLSIRYTKIRWRPLVYLRES